MAKVAITKRVLDAARPGDKPIFLWDETLAGFGVKVTPAGAKVFVAQYRTGGRGTPTKRVTIGRHGALTVDQAKKRARELLGQVAAGADPAAERRQAKEAAAQAQTVADVAAEWLRRDQASNRRVADVERFLRVEVLPVWGARPISDIRKRDVIELLDAIVDRGAPISANRVLAIVRRLMNWAAGRDVIDANPAQFVEAPATETKRDRVLDNGELLEVWNATGEMGYPFGSAVQLLILTGLRRDEIFRLSWSEIDLDAAVIRLPASRVKNAEGRTVPLSAQAVELLAGLPRIGDAGWTFTTSGAAPVSGYSKMKARLDKIINDARQAEGREAMAPWRLHDIRRSVATGLQALGQPLQVIETVLGHVSGSRSGIVGRYQKHAYAAEHRAALDAWGRHVEALVSGAADNVVEMRRRA